MRLSRVVPFIATLLVAGCGAPASGSGSPVAVRSAAPSSVTAPAAPSESALHSARAAASAAIPVLGTLRIARSIPTPGFGPITIGDGSVWVVDNADNGFTGEKPNGDIYRIDLVRPKDVTKIGHAQGGFPTVGEGALWLVNAEFGETVTRVDTKNGHVRRFKTSTTDEPVPEAVVTTPGAVWVGHNGDGTVARIDPKTLAVVKTIPLAPSGVGGVRGWAATDGRSVWFPNTHDREIVRIDATTNEISSRLELPLVAHPDRPADVDLPDDVVSGAEGLLVVGDGLYASSASHVYVIDISEPGSDHIVGDIPTDGFWAVRLANAEDGTVWGLMPDGRSLIRIDAATERIVGRVVIPASSELGAPHPSLGLFGNSVWVRYPGMVLELTLP